MSQRLLVQNLTVNIFLDILLSTPALPYLAQLYILLEPLLETLVVLLRQVVLGVQVMAGR